MKVKWLLSGMAVLLLWACIALPAHGEFTLGTEFQAGDTIQTLTVGIDVGGDTDALQEPLALDLGLGFPLWLHPVGRQQDEALAVRSDSAGRRCGQRASAGSPRHVHLPPGGRARHGPTAGDAAIARRRPRLRHHADRICQPRLEQLAPGRLLRRGQRPAVCLEQRGQRSDPSGAGSRSGQTGRGRFPNRTHRDGTRRVAESRGGPARDARRPNAADRSPDAARPAAA